MARTRVLPSRFIEEGDLDRLSPKQEAILGFLKGFQDEHGYAPSVREIQSACGISSTSVVDYNLRLLEQKGLLRRDREVSRGIDLRSESGGRAGLQEVPVLGTIAAGAPIDAPDAESRSADPDDVVRLPGSALAGRGEVYALRVKGTSMVQDLIGDGDIVVVEARRDARNGDIVVAWLSGERETTLKRYYDEGERIRLQPANDDMEPIYVDPANLVIQGRFVALLRGDIA